MIVISICDYVATIIHKNNGTNGNICAKVAFPMYTESVKFKSQSRETASKRIPYRGLGSHPRDNGHVTR